MKNETHVCILQHGMQIDICGGYYTNIQYNEIAQCLFDVKTEIQLLNAELKYLPREIKNSGILEFNDNNYMQKMSINLLLSMSVEIFQNESKKYTEQQVLPP